MSDFNPYAPPVDDGGPPIQDAMADSLDDAGPVPFFPVGALKLGVLSLVTLNIYSVYWFYAQWKAIKIRTGANVSPLGRSLFALFFAHSLFSRVHIAATHSTGRSPFVLGGMTAAYVLLNLASRLPDPFWLVSLASAAPLVIVQQGINAHLAKVAPHAPKNDKFTVMNWVAIVLGTIVLALAVLGALAEG